MTPDERAHDVLKRWQDGSPFDPLESPFADAIREAEREAYLRGIEDAAKVSERRDLNEWAVTEGIRALAAKEEA